MKLSEQQIAEIKKWAKEGNSLSEIQNKLDKEFGLKMTYMEARLLMLEIGIEIQDKRQSSTVLQQETAKAENGVVAEESEEDDDLSEIDSDDSIDSQSDQGIKNVNVSVDRITVPGAIVSGTVTFSDGNTANWQIDQYGRIAVSGTKHGYKPSREDLMAFQVKLRDLLEKRGF